MHVESMAVGGHGRCGDRFDGLPTKPASWLCSWGHLQLGQSLRSTFLPRREERSSRRGLLEPSSSSAVGEASLPPHPHPIVGSPAGDPPPLFRWRRRRSPVSPLKGRPGELGSFVLSVDARHCVLPARPCRAAGRACSSLEPPCSPW